MLLWTEFCVTRCRLLADPCAHTLMSNSKSQSNYPGGINHRHDRFSQPPTPNVYIHTKPIDNTNLIDSIYFVTHAPHLLQKEEVVYQSAAISRSDGIKVNADAMYAPLKGTRQMQLKHPPPHRLECRCFFVKPRMCEKMDKRPVTVFAWNDTSQGPSFVLLRLEEWISNADEE